MNVSLVIPGRNCERTIRACLEAATPLLANGQLSEIVFVDDGSTDETVKIVAEYPVKIVCGQGGGAGAARNLGWRAAQGEWVWFIDSDCVPEPTALQPLLALANDPGVAGVGGSYANMLPQSLVASLIHEEIVARHARMSTDVNFLGTFNVLYRRTALEAVGGFDEYRYNGPGVAAAEDMELAFRLVDGGWRLCFTPASRVGHFHPTHFLRYLKVQARHGYYRMRLYADHPRRTRGDSYSGLVDHAQPPLAMLLLAALPLAFFSMLWAAPFAILLLLMLLQLPMTTRMLRRMASWKCLAYVPFGFVRAFARGFGMTAGTMAVIGQCFAKRSPSRATKAIPTNELPESDLARISVVVCVHNRPQQILDCLNSLTRCVRPQFEIIVVDDASTDDSAEQVRRFAARHPQLWLRLISLDKNRGVSGARNAGIRAARGEVVLFTDSDCLVDERWCERLAAPLLRGEVSAAGGWVQDAQPRNLCELSFFGNLSLTPGCWQSRRLPGCNMGFLRGALLEHPFDEQLTYGCDEDDVARRMVAAGHRVAFVEDAKVRHCHPMTLRPYLRQAMRQGQGSARYWFKHGTYVGRDIMFGVLALVALPTLLIDLRSVWFVSAMIMLQVGAVWFNEWWLKRLSLLASVAVLPVALTYNAVKTASVLWTLGRILLGREPQAWQSRTNHATQRLAIPLK
jgi:glycosyltransferase involved in cell wall biosynthesis